MTKADEKRSARVAAQQEALRENPPWSEENKNTERQHTHEIKSLESIRIDMENLALALETQRTRYELSALIIPEGLPEQLKALSDAIYDEELTRDAAGRPTKDSMIALKAKEAQGS